MDPTAPPNREKDLFEQALDLASVEERMAFVRGACGDDGALCARVLVLLRAHESGESFLPDEPAAVAAAGLAAVQVGDRIGRYRLMEKIGEGGCGLVFVAEQEEPVRRRVALKVIKLGMDTQQMVARFEAERQALALMDHPNIAKILDAGATEAGRPYFVMELVRGIRITDYCDQNKLSTRERLELFVQVCSALQHAHQKGIIHRDIKPSNVLVTLHDEVAVPKVIDFGIAKAMEGKLTEKTLYTAFEQFIGTPAYTSPEQAGMSGLDIDTRSDIYSLGVLLYELLTGQTPFESQELVAAGLEEMRRTIREKEPVRPSTRLSKLEREELTTTAQRRGTEPPKLISLMRGDLDWIVMKCLEKDRRRRYDTVNGLALDVEHHVEHEPVAARPPSTAYRLEKFVRRNKVLVGAAVAVALVLVLGIIVSTGQAVRAKRAEQRAEAEANLARQAEKTAREKSRVAEAEQKRADETSQELRHNLYVANMNLAQQAWEQNSGNEFRQALEEAADYPGRGFEWYYWQRQAHLELLILRGHVRGVTTAVFSPDGQQIITGGWDGIAKVWQAATGRELLTLRGHSAPILLVAVSPDGQRIATASWDHTAKVWEAATGKELLTLKGHGDRIESVAFSPDGQRVASGGWDCTAKVWDAGSGKELLTLKGHSAYVECAAFSPDGLRIVTGSDDQTAKIWEAASGKELLTLKGHGAPIYTVAFSPDGQRIVTAGEDGTARVWEASSGKGSSSPNWESGVVSSVAFSPDLQRTATGYGDGRVKVWEVASGRALLTLRGHTNRVLSVTFSSDGSRIVTASSDQTAKVWEATNGYELLTLKGRIGVVNAAALSADGQRIVTGETKVAKVWETASGKELLTLHGHRGAISSLAFSPDGHRIVTGGEDGTVKVWEAASGQALLILTGHTNRVMSVAFSLDGQRIVTGSLDETAKVWEVASGKELLRVKGRLRGVRSVAFSPDGQRIVSGHMNRAKVWETVSGKEVLTLKTQGNAIMSVAFSRDGRCIATGNEDGTANLWEAATAQQVAGWQREEKAALANRE